MKAVIDGLRVSDQVAGWISAVYSLSFSLSDFTGIDLNPILVSHPENSKSKNKTKSTISDSLFRALEEEGGEMQGIYAILCLLISELNFIF